MSRLRAAPMLLLAAVGCARASGAGDPAACVAVPASLTGRPSLAHLAGQFGIILLATTGDSSNRHTSGSVRLRPSSRRDAAMTGTADLQVERVGAYRVGSLAATADSAPGVLVFADTTAGVLVRLGSAANTLGGRTPIEGEYTVLVVHRLDESGFAGSWRSGANVQRASGHFCARRLDRP